MRTKKKLLIVVMVVAVVAFCASSTLAMPLQADPSGYYKFGYTDGNTYAAKVEMGVGAIKAYVMPNMHTVYVGIIIGDKIYFDSPFNQPSWGVLTRIDEDMYLITSHSVDSGEITSEYSAVRITREEADEITDQNEAMDKNNVCINNLKLLGLYLNRFAKDHDNEMPYDLSQLYPDYAADKNIFVCPSRGGEFRDYDSDYEYIPGFSVGAPNPGQEKLIIERRGNHSSPIDSHHVLYLDGHVEFKSD